jgi:hypothetical protein
MKTFTKKNLPLMIFQYFTAASVYGLNVLGIKGNIILKTEGNLELLFINDCVCFKFKIYKKEQRPDGVHLIFSFRTHTATHYLLDEFFMARIQRCIWYGICGYL